MRGKRLLALVVVFGLGFAACGDDSDSNSGDGGDTAGEVDAGSGEDGSDAGSDDATSDDAGSDDATSDDASTDDATSDDASTDDATPDDASTDDGSEAAPAGGASVLVFGGEEITLNARGCYAEQQEVAGSIITLTAQASGTNAAGEDVLVDFTRFAPGGTVGESDDLLIDIGPLGASQTYQAAFPFDSVPVVDGVLTVPETTFSSFDDGSEVTGSVSIVC